MFGLRCYLIFNNQQYKKLSMLKLSLIIFYSIIFSINVHAANWNQNKQTKLPSLPESIINNFTPNQKIISSIDDREYSFCSLENLDWTGRDIYKVDKFLQKYSDYFNSDYVSVFKDTETGKLVEGKEVYGYFEDGLILIKDNLSLPIVRS